MFRTFKAFGVSLALRHIFRAPQLRSRFLTGLFATSVSLALYDYTRPKLGLDSSFYEAKSVTVDNSINAFPTELKSEEGKPFSLLGYGTRKVTFLKFKVYGLGIYIADEDIRKVPVVLDLRFLSSITDADPSKSHQENLAIALKDPKMSEILINNLLDANIKFIVRIVPLRDTDFNHLRDGFVKSCVRNQLVKEQAPEQLDHGISEIRDIFKKYRSKCPKNHEFLVETDDQGKTTFIYKNYGKHPEKQKLKEKVELGTVSEPIVSKALLLNYIAGSSPISEEARLKCVEKLVNLC